MVHHVPYSTKSSSGRHDLSGLKFALVYPPYGPVKNEPGIKTVKELRYFPFTIIALCRWNPRKCWCRSTFIDAHAEDLTLEETVRRLNEFGPDFIGYTLTTYLFFQSLGLDQSDQGIGRCSSCRWWCTLIDLCKGNTRLQRHRLCRYW